jgi:hypothetical protein
VVSGGLAARQSFGQAREVHLDDLRVAAGLLLTAGAVRAMLPAAPGLPCPLRALTGIPCPLCGMTTSVTATARLDLAAALAATPAGVVAVVGALALLLFRQRRSVRVPVWALPAALLAMWVFQLQRFGVV